jgi:hypothetical protein
MASGRWVVTHMPPGPTFTVRTLIADPVRRRSTHSRVSSVRCVPRRSATP